QTSQNFIACVQSSRALFACNNRFFFFFSSRRRHTRFSRDWSSDVCSSDLRKFHFCQSFVLCYFAKLMSFIFKIFKTGELYILKRSEERRVGKECSFRCLPYHKNKNDNQ